MEVEDIGRGRGFPGKLFEKVKGFFQGRKASIGGTNSETEGKTTSSFKEAIKELHLTRAEKRELRKILRYTKKTLTIEQTREQTREQIHEQRDKTVFDRFAKALATEAQKVTGSYGPPKAPATEAQKVTGSYGPPEAPATKARGIRKFFVNDLAGVAWSINSTDLFRHVIEQSRQSAIRGVVPQEAKLEREFLKGEFNVTDTGGDRERPECIETCERHAIPPKFQGRGPYPTAKGWISIEDFQAMTKAIELGLLEEHEIREMPPIRVNARTHTIDVRVEKPAMEEIQKIQERPLDDAFEYATLFLKLHIGRQQSGKAGTEILTQKESERLDPLADQFRSANIDVNAMMTVYDKCREQERFSLKELYEYRELDREFDEEIKKPGGGVLDIPKRLYILNKKYALKNEDFGAVSDLMNTLGVPEREGLRKTEDLEALQKNALFTKTEKQKIKRFQESQRIGSSFDAVEFSMDRGGAITDFRDGSTNLQKLSEGIQKIKKRSFDPFEYADRVLKGGSEGVKRLEKLLHNAGIRVDEIDKVRKNWHQKSSSNELYNTLKSGTKEGSDDTLVVDVFSVDILRENEYGVKHDDVELFRKFMDVLILEGEKLSKTKDPGARHESPLLTEEDNREIQREIQRFQERRKAVDELLIQRISSGLETVKFSEDSGDVFYLFQTSLMDEKVKKEKGGFFHDEENAMLDMQYAFQDIQDATITFEDGAEPSIERDEEGNVTVVYPRLDNIKKDSLKIHSCLLNISTQGNMQNLKGTAEVINKEGLEDLREAAKKKFGILQDKENMKHLEEIEAKITDLGKKLTPPKALFEKVKGVFGLSVDQSDVAAEFALIQHEIAGNEGSVGANCFSGTNRTGEMVATTFKKFIANTLEEAANEQERARIEKRAATHFMRPDGITRQIAWENVGVRALKLKKLVIDGLKTAERIAMSAPLWFRRAAAKAHPERALHIA